MFNLDSHILGNLCN